VPKYRITPKSTGHDAVIGERAGNHPGTTGDRADRQVDAQNAASSANSAMRCETCRPSATLTAYGYGGRIALMSATSSVQGRVIRTSGEPLGKARVILERNEPMSQLSYLAVSEADGRFRLDQVDPGQYRLAVQRNGYVNAAGSRDWFQGAVLLTLAPGKTVDDILVTMAPQAVISGRISDEDGEPLADTPVTLLQQPTVREGPPLVPVPGPVRFTNDLGEFRIPGLHPGTYLLCANWDQARHHHMGMGIQIGPPEQEVYPLLYYPGVADYEKAAPIEVTAGEELFGFDLQMKKVRAFRVRGRVELPKDADPRTLFLNLGQHQVRGGFGGGGRAGFQHQGTEFEFGGLLPGSYHLIAQCGGPQRLHKATMPVEVNDQDIDGLVVTFPAGATIEGTVQASDGPSADFHPASVYVSLVPPEGGMQIGGGPADASGTIRLSDIPPGRYCPAVFLVPERGYVKSVTYGGRDVRNDPIEIGDDLATARLEVLIAFDGGEIRGALQDAGGLPMTNRNVHLLTDPPRFDRFKTVRTDQDGRFHFAHIRPAEYWLFAVERPAGAPLEQLWECHDGVAGKVTVVSTSHENVLLRLPKKGGG